jgi:RNA polymerase sigma-70 factor (ECF subfamily)
VGPSLSPERIRELGRALAAAAPSGRPAPPSPEAIAPAVEEAVRRARAAWPKLDVDLGGFFAHVGARLPDEGDWAQAIGGLAVEDLYLAFACARNDGAALRAFERELAGELAAAFEKLRIPDARRDDAKQRLWEKLFVGNPSPRILEYSGRGRLRFWFRVTVLRALLDEVRAQKRRHEVQDEDLLLGAASAEANPEIEHLKRVYRREFSTAFEDAVRALSPEERNVLRSTYTESMTIDQIAAAFGIHRATAARRVNAAKESLLRETRRRLSERLSLSSRELDSVFRLIESRLHISVGRLLR